MTLAFLVAMETVMITINSGEGTYDYDRDFLHFCIGDVRRDRDGEKERVEERQLLL